MSVFVSIYKHTKIVCFLPTILRNPLRIVVFVHFGRRNGIMNMKKSHLGSGGLGVRHRRNE